MLNSSTGNAVQTVFSIQMKQNSLSVLLSLIKQETILDYYSDSGYLCMSGSRISRLPVLMFQMYTLPSAEPAAR